MLVKEGHCICGDNIMSSIILNLLIPSPSVFKLLINLITLYQALTITYYFTDISPACHMLWNNSDRLSRIYLPDSSIQLLYTKGLITHASTRRMWISFGYLLSQDELRDIYAAVDNDPNKLRDFAEILLLSYGTSSLAIDLLKEYCKSRV